LNRALYHGLAQAVGSGDKTTSPESRIRYPGELTRSTGFGAHHALHASREGDHACVKTLMPAVGNKQRSLKREANTSFAAAVTLVHGRADIQEGFLLAGEEDRAGFLLQ